MKRTTLMALMLSICCVTAVAHNNAPADTVDVYSQFGHMFLTGNITDLDKEDTIKQVEINDAHTGWVGFDNIFSNGFELYNVNWILIGDDSDDNEFGYAMQCVDEHDWKDSHGDTHVVLSNCHLLFNEPNRASL